MKQVHCCETMSALINDLECALNYNPKFREYTIGANKKSIVRNVIYFCPWCGNKLPKSLRAEYFKILADEYSPDVNLESYKNLDFPDDFKSDSWWKKRSNTEI